MATRKHGIVKKIIIALLAALVIIQFFHPEKNTTGTATAQDISAIYPMPDSVHMILQKACNDCHSNNTTYPWYSNIQPVAWWLNDHIQEGKRELNFSEFGSYSLGKQAKKLKKIAHEVQEGDMPLGSYTLIHRNAVLSDNEKNLIIDWASHLSQQVAGLAPPATK